MAEEGPTKSPGSRGRSPLTTPVDGFFRPSLATGSLGSLPLARSPTWPWASHQERPQGQSRSRLEQSRPVASSPVSSWLLSLTVPSSPIFPRLSGLQIFTEGFAALDCPHEQPVQAELPLHDVSVPSTSKAISIPRALPGPRCHSPTSVHPSRRPQPSQVVYLRAIGFHPQIKAPGGVRRDHYLHSIRFSDADGDCSTTRSSEGVSSGREFSTHVLRKVSLGPSTGPSMSL